MLPINGDKTRIRSLAGLFPTNDLPASPGLRKGYRGVFSANKTFKPVFLKCPVLALFKLFPDMTYFLKGDGILKLDQRTKTLTILSNTK